MSNRCLRVRHDMAWVSKILQTPSMSLFIEELQHCIYCKFEGDDTTVFVNEMDEEMVIAIGYRRVLYGDHGPYLEFTYHQMCWEAGANIF